jgi:putative copper resistance protein D
MGSTGQFVGSWSLEWFWLIAMSVAATIYWLGVRRVNRLNPTQQWHTGQTALFALGLVIIAIATIGPVGSVTSTFFWADMASHILLMMLAAPLIVLSNPTLLLLRSSNREFRRRWCIPFLRSRFLKFVTNPITGWLVFTMALLATHIGPLFEFALERSALRTIAVPLIYFTAGLIYYYPLIGSSIGATRIPSHYKIVSMFTMMIPEAVLGFAIYTTGSVLYPYYERVTLRPWGPSTALLDQRVGGAVMWGAGMVLDTIWISIVVAEWWKREEFKAKRLDTSTR